MQARKCNQKGCEQVALPISALCRGCAWNIDALAALESGEKRKALKILKSAARKSGHKVSDQETAFLQTGLTQSSDPDANWEPGSKRGIAPTCRLLAGQAKGWTPFDFVLWSAALHGPKAEWTARNLISKLVNKEGRLVERGGKLWATQKAGSGD